MIFGDPADLAIEAYHEPSGPKWKGFGRMTIHIQGIQLGNIREAHCSLFHPVDVFRELLPTIASLRDESFEGLSDGNIFALLDEALYLGEVDRWDRFGHFDFLTNAGEPFSGTKTFIVSDPKGHVRVLYHLRDATLGSASCTVSSFRHVAASFVDWFDEQVRTEPSSYFPVEPELS